MSPSPMVSSNHMSNVGGTCLGGWNFLQHERLGGPQEMTMDWQGAPASPSSYIAKKILCLEMPFHFVGRLLGPRGNSLKWVEASTGCRVYISGKGSIKIQGKRISFMGDWAMSTSMTHCTSWSRPNCQLTLLTQD
ncbi:hypothetical protein MKW92_042126 [Papaver armeniacum]|nr:hypothetical protein MKW92_042126 [Papaver armeniacum]